MTINLDFLPKKRGLTKGLSGLLFFTALCIAPMVSSLPAWAQAEADQQLPPEYAQDQIPSSFPEQDGGAASPTSDQTEASEDVPFLEEAQTTPAQPEETKLVPATPMGEAANRASQGFSEVTSEQPALSEQSDGPENGDFDSILDQYRARAQESAELDFTGDDNLPDVPLSGSPALDPASMGGVGVEAVAVPQKTQEELQQEIREDAFDAAITGMFPLTPSQIEAMLGKYDEAQQATFKPVYEPPTPEISVMNVSLDPGVAPPSIKTAVGNVTTLNILDATGAPWPVQDVTWAGDYEIVEPEEGGHIIRITPLRDFTRGNIVIRLLTLKTPLTMTLETGRNVVQYRVDARIPEYGPFASMPIMQGGKGLVAGSPDLTSLLDGVMPGGMTKLHVSGVDGRTTAYSMGEVTYVRTPMTLLSPAWKSSVSSADGMNVYELVNAPVLLLSDGGEFVRATLSEKEGLLDE